MAQNKVSRVWGFFGMCDQMQALTSTQVGIIKKFFFCDNVREIQKRSNQIGEW